MARKKKKFGETTVGKILGGALGLINPTLGNLVTGTSTVEDLIQGIGEAKASPEEKIRAKELVLEAYEAEVSDRISARNREAVVAAAGGNDILFKTVGWGITFAFLASNLASFGAFGDIPEDMIRVFDRSYGAVNALMVMVVSYYFGSSFGSKQKTHIMNELNKDQ